MNGVGNFERRVWRAWAIRVLPSKNAVQTVRKGWSVQKKQAGENGVNSIMMQVTWIRHASLDARCAAAWGLWWRGLIDNQLGEEEPFVARAGRVRCGDPGHETGMSSALHKRRGIIAQHEPARRRQCGQGQGWTASETTDVMGRPGDHMERFFRFAKRRHFGWLAASMGPGFSNPKPRPTADSGRKEASVAGESD